MAKNLKTLLQTVFSLDVMDDTMLLGIAYDSRNVMPGECFCAYKGYAHDGQHYIAQAIENGANAVLLEAEQSISAPQWQCYRGKKIPIYQVAHLKAHLGQLAAWFYGYPSLHMKVIGVTGTNGKTSYCHLLAQALVQYGFKATIIGNLGYGDINHLEPTLNTTLNAVENQKLLAEFRDQGVEYVVMEVSSHALDQGRVDGIGFHLTVFTNLTQDHLDYHTSIENYAACKRKLFSPNTAAIVNADDDMGRNLIAELPNVIAYGFKADVASHKYVKLGKISQHEKIANICFSSFAGEGQFSTALLGMFNVYNLMAVAASLLKLNLSIKAVCQLLTYLKPVPGRMEHFTATGRPHVYVDYAHTPDALAQVLKSLKSLRPHKLICVFGCGGNRDQSKRPLMAKAVAEHANFAVVTTDNPRNENQDDIVKNIICGFDSADYKVIHKRDDAIQYAIRTATSDDIVLIAGKGRDDYQEIQGQRYAHSDVATVEAILKESLCSTL